MKCRRERSEENLIGFEVIVDVVLLIDLTELFQGNFIECDIREFDVATVFVVVSDAFDNQDFLSSLRD